MTIGDFKTVEERVEDVLSQGINIHKHKVLMGVPDYSLSLDLKGKFVGVIAHSKTGEGGHEYPTDAVGIMRKNSQAYEVVHEFEDGIEIALNCGLDDILFKTKLCGDLHPTAGNVAYYRADSPMFQYAWRRVELREEDLRRVREQANGDPSTEAFLVNLDLHRIICTPNGVLIPVVDFFLPSREYLKKGEPRERFLEAKYARGKIFENFPNSEKDC